MIQRSLRSCAGVVFLWLSTVAASVSLTISILLAVRLIGGGLSGSGSPILNEDDPLLDAVVPVLLLFLNMLAICRTARPGETTLAPISIERLVLSMLVCTGGWVYIAVQLYAITALHNTSGSAPTGTAAWCGIASKLMLGAMFLAIPGYSLLHRRPPQPAAARMSSPTVSPAARITGST